MAEKPVKQQKRYLSYLLRLWQEKAGGTPGGDPPLWRASLERPQSDERQGFDWVGRRDDHPKRHGRSDNQLLAHGPSIDFEPKAYFCPRSGVATPPADGFEQSISADF